MHTSTHFGPEAVMHASVRVDGPSGGAPRLRLVRGWRWRASCLALVASALAVFGAGGCEGARGAMTGGDNAQGDVADTWVGVPEDGAGEAGGWADEAPDAIAREEVGGEPDGALADCGAAAGSEEPQLGFVFRMEGGAAGQGALLALRHGLLLFSDPPCVTSLTNRQIEELNALASAVYWDGLVDQTGCSSGNIQHRLTVELPTEERGIRTFSKQLCEVHWDTPQPVYDFVEGVQRVTESACAPPVPWSTFVMFSLLRDPEAPVVLEHEELLTMNLQLHDTCLSLGLVDGWIVFANKAPYRSVELADSHYDDLLERARGAEWPEGSLPVAEWCIAPDVHIGFGVYGEDGERVSRGYDFCIVEAPGRVPETLTRMLASVRGALRLALDGTRLTLFPAESDYLFLDGDGVGRSAAPIDLRFHWQNSNLGLEVDFGALGGQFWSGHTCLRELPAHTVDYLRELADDVDWSAVSDAISTATCPPDSPITTLQVRLNEEDGEYVEYNKRICMLTTMEIAAGFQEFVETLEQLRYIACDATPAGYAPIL